MFGRKKTTQIDHEQQALFKHANERVKEKKGLYNHFIFYLVGCLFLVLINLVFKIGLDWKFFGLDWFVYAILVWSFLFLVHSLKVLAFSNFMNKAWEEEQLQHLVEKQKEKIAKMQEKLDLQLPKEYVTEKNVLLDKTQSQDETNTDPETLP